MTSLSSKPAGGRKRQAGQEVDDDDDDDDFLALVGKKSKQKFNSGAQGTWQDLTVSPETEFNAKKKRRSIFKSWKVTGVLQATLDFSTYIFS